MYMYIIGRSACLMMIVRRRNFYVMYRPVRTSSYQSPRNSPITADLLPATSHQPRERHRQHVGIYRFTAHYNIYVGYTEQEAEGFHSHKTSWKQLSQIACNCRHPTPNKSCLVCAGLPRRLPRLGSAGTPPRPSASSTPPRRRPMGLLVAAEVGHHWDQKLPPSLRKIRSPSS